MMADLYTFTLVTGEVYRWTSADTDLVLNGDFFSCNGPIIERGNTRLKTGLEVDTLDITLGFGDGPLARNLLPLEYARFTGGNLPAMVGSPVDKGVPELDLTESNFGGGSLKFPATGGDFYRYLSPGHTTYNLKLSGGKSYICSAYVRCNQSSKTGQFYLRDDQNVHHGSSWKTSAEPNTWTRVSRVLTIPDETVNWANFRIDNDGGDGCDMWFDGLMVEEQIDGATEPSPFVMPFGDIAPSPAAAANGAFDGARVKLERVFMPTWGDTSPGSIELFEGEVAGVDPSRYSVRLTVKSELDRLNVPMPQIALKPACAYTVYDAGCGLDRAAWTVNGTVGAGATQTFVPSDLNKADKYFDLGVLAITSGPAAGARRAVRAYANGNFTLSMPLPAAPNPGDSFSVYPGCYRTKAACEAKGNEKRFRGYPYVPVPEQAR